MSIERNDHSLYSSYREMLIEHLFSGEVMRTVWLTGSAEKRIEILKPQVDDGGYDIVLEARGIVRHVQLKATFVGSTVKRFNIHKALSEKPSGCVICVLVDMPRFELGPFYWFGGGPGEKLPSLDSLAIAKHTKGDSTGKKNARPNIRVLPITKFQKIGTYNELVLKLFGPDNNARAA